MRWMNIAAGVICTVLVVLVLAAVFGVPADWLIGPLTREAAEKNGLQMRVGGPARLTIWPQVGFSAEKLAVRDEKGLADLFAVDGLRVGLSLSHLVTGHIHLTDVALTRPTVNVQSLLDRAARIAAARTPGRTNADAGSAGATMPVEGLLAVDTVTAQDAVFVVREARDTTEIKVEEARLVVSLPTPNGHLRLTATGRMGGRSIRFTADADDPARLGDGKPLPVDAALEIAGLLRRPLSLSAAVQTSGPVLRLDSLRVTSDQGRVTGTVSASFAGAKPFIDAALEAERLDLTGLIGTAAPARAQPASADRAGGGREPWSDAPIAPFGLRLFEGDLKLAASEVMVDKIRIAPAVVEATLLQDTMTVSLGRSGVYGGEAGGELTIDRSRDLPALALRLDFSNLGALPFLTDAIDFRYVEGRARGKLDLKAAGDSPRRVMQSLQGSAELAFEDGAVRGINLAKMLRSVLDTILSGWQESASDETRFSALSATFQVKNGLARTDDLRFVGPFLRASGSGVVNVPAQTLDFRTDPKVVATPEGQGGRADASTASWGIGVPVLIQGSWAEPKIYADVPNILSNPEAALGALRQGLGDAGKPAAGSPIGKLLEGLVPNRDSPKGDAAKGNQPLDGAAIANELLKALTGKDDAAPPADGKGARTPGQGAADILKGLFGR